MGHIIINALTLFVIIFSGWFVKRIGLLSKADGGTLSQIIVNVTLPAVIIVNLSRLEFSGTLLLLIPGAVLVTFLQILLGKLAAAKNPAQGQLFLMYGVSGFNIGNFTLPFVQSFFSAGIPLLSVFDIGNSIMLAGGTTVVIDGLTGRSERVSVLTILKKLLRTPPFTCYLLMLLLRLLQVALPEGFLSVLAPVAGANTFLSMFMIGLYLELRLPRSSLGLVLKVLLTRYSIGGGLLLAVLLLPIPRSLKMILCLLAVTPIPLFSVINSVAAGVKEEIVGFSSSVSFLLSLLLMTIIVGVFGV